MFTTFEIEQSGVIITIQIHEAHEFSQTYEVLAGSALIRMKDGTAVKQTHWEKLGTQISCSGVIPAGITAIDFTQSYILRCGAKRAIASPNSNITLPVERRSDAPFEPKGFGWVPDDSGTNTWTETPVVMVGDVATLTPIAGATVYRAYYWPEIVVFSDAPAESTNVHTSEMSWTLNAEQV